MNLPYLDLCRPPWSAKRAPRARVFHSFLSCPQMFHVALTHLNNQEYWNQRHTDISVPNLSLQRSMNLPAKNPVAFQASIPRVKNRVEPPPLPAKERVEPPLYPAKNRAEPPLYPAKNRAEPPLYPAKNRVALQAQTFRVLQQGVFSNQKLTV